MRLEHHLARLIPLLPPMQITEPCLPQPLPASALRRALHARLGDALLPALIRSGDAERGARFGDQAIQIRGGEILGLSGDAFPAHVEVLGVGVGFPEFADAEDGGDGIPGVVALDLLVFLAYVDGLAADVDLVRRGHGGI